MSERGSEEEVDAVRDLMAAVGLTDPPRPPPPVPDRLYVAWVPRVHDALSCDLSFSDPVVVAYLRAQRVTLKPYIYYDLVPNGKGGYERTVEKIGYECRARLEGISNVRSDKNHEAYHKAHLFVEYYLQLMNGFVYCRLVPEPDRYSRCLVELFDPVLHTSLNRSIIAHFPQIYARWQREGNAPRTRTGRSESGARRERASSPRSAP